MGIGIKPLKFWGSLGHGRGYQIGVQEGYVERMKRANVRAMGMKAALRGVERGKPFLDLGVTGKQSDGKP